MILVGKVPVVSQKTKKYMPNEKMIEGNLEVKLPAPWTNGQAEVGRVRERERVRRKKIQAHEKVGSRETLCFSNDLWLRRVEK